MDFSKLALILIIALAIRQSKSLTCQKCEYTEGVDDDDDSCLSGWFVPEVVSSGDPPEGKKFVCTVELKTKDGRIFAVRDLSTIDISEKDIEIDGPIQYTKNPEKNYIQYRSCETDRCNDLGYGAPPTLNPPSDIKCYWCGSSESHCEVGPDQLEDIPKIPEDRFPPNVTLATPASNSSSRTTNHYTSEPIGEFLYLAYCETAWRYENAIRRFHQRNRMWAHEEIHGVVNGKCFDRKGSDGMDYVHCYCRGHGCNGGVEEGLQCYECQYRQNHDPDPYCWTAPQTGRVIVNGDEGIPDGMKWVCTTEIKYAGGDHYIYRHSQLIKSTEPSNQCLEGPRGNTTNPELNYITICSCDTQRCNNNGTFDRPPKVPSKKCYNCLVAQDPGCDIPDPKYLEEISGIPWTYLSNVNRDSQLNELTPSEPIGKFDIVIYCRTSRASDSSLVARGANWFSEVENGDMDGKCELDEVTRVTHCYCRKNGCNGNDGGGPTLECYDCEHSYMTPNEECKSNPQNVLMSPSAPAGMQYIRLYPGGKV